MNIPICIIIGFIILAGLLVILALMKAGANADKDLKEFHAGMKKSIEKAERKGGEK